MTTIRTLIVAAAGVTAAMSLSVPAGHAGTYGNAPWCAVLNVGAGTVSWDCEYRSAEECSPHVIGGLRGFCNMNPRFVPAAPVPTRHRRRHS
jgi:hypothetical protein